MLACVVITLSLLSTVIGSRSSGVAPPLNCPGMLPGIIDTCSCVITLSLFPYIKGSRALLARLLFHMAVLPFKLIHFPVGSLLDYFTIT